MDSMNIGTQGERKKVLAKSKLLRFPSTSGDPGNVKESMAAYSLKNHLIFSLIAVFAFFVHGASDVGRINVSVFVMKGDSVTLHANITLNQQNRVKWYFNVILIAELNLSHFCTDVQCNEGTEKFRDRLKLDHQTGDLIITNINTSDVGVYQLMIFSSSSHTRNGFDVSVRDVAAEMKRKSVKEGDSVTLDPPEEKKPNNLLTWYFNDTLINEITGDPNKICTDDKCDGRFRDRLKVDRTGSLIITNTRTTDSGLYKLQIKSRRNHYSVTSIMSYSVSVTDSGLSSTDIAKICGAVVVLLLTAVAAGVIYYCCRRSRKDSVAVNESALLFCTDKGSPHDGRGSQHRAGTNGGHLQIVPPKMSYSAPPFHRLPSLLDKIEYETESETE